MQLVTTLRPSLNRLLKGRITLAAVLATILVVGIVRELVIQYQENLFLSETAWRIVHTAHAEDRRSRIIALRDYIRTNVTHEGAPYHNRPYFRATAAETLQTHLGYCGEVSRVFINLAAAVGIRAQRINLDGKIKHVVAEAELSPNKFFIVDSQNPSKIADLEPLDQVMMRPEFDDYFTLNLRRLHLGWIASRHRIELSRFSYWIENPHLIKATLLASLLFIGLLGKLARVALRMALQRRGWLHVSSLDQANLATPPTKSR